MLEALRRLLAADPALDWEWKIARSQIRSPADGIAELTIDGKRRLFQIECKLRPTVRDILRLAERPQENGAWLLAAPSLSEALVNECRRLKLNCVDLNGRIWLRTQGVLVDRQVTKKRYRPPQGWLDPFQPRSSRLPRTLLAAPEHSWSQQNLIDRTGLSPGLVSRLIRQFVDEGIIIKDGRIFRLADANTLLDQWSAADAWTKRTTVFHYSTLNLDFQKLANQLKSVWPTGLVFTQWFAASLRHPYTTPPVLSAYVHGVEGERFERTLGIRRVSEGGTLWLIVPKDDGVFRETQTANGFTLASDAQIYLDLLHVGLRGPDQAKALREWSGFMKAGS